MRVVRFLLLVMGMAATVAGCAQQPVAYMVYPPAGAQHPAAGIDHVVYGTGGPYVPSRPAVAYAPPPNPAPGPVPNQPLTPAYVAACRGCAGPRPRVHDGAGSCGCDGAALRRSRRRWLCSKWSPRLRR